MKEWKTYALEEICTGKGTYGIGASAVAYDSSKYTYLRITDINDDGTLNKGELKSVDDEEAYKYILQKNDIVFARTGNSTGRSYFYDGTDGELVYAGFLIKFSLDPSKVNPRIMKYYTHSQDYYDWVKSFDTGGTRGNINAKTYGLMPITLPPREVQDKIVEVLRSIDEKIELNKRINDNLEQQAQALYKSWFIDNYQTEWPEYSLDEVTLKITDGVHNTVIDTPNGEYYLLSCKNIKNRRLNMSSSDRRIDEGTFNKLRKRTMLSKGDILLSSVGTIGELMLLNDDPHNYEFQRSVAIIKPNPVYISSYYLYETLISQIDKITNTAHGAVQQCIFLSDLKEYTINIADKALIRRYDIIVKPFFDEITKREKEIARLTSLRDSLLPKLMSGELKINEIDC